jgi:GH25 family lysozyme M1 (1,4-beta-N-acetylmuramidase)
MTNAFGIDISRYNYSADGSQKPDFEKVKQTTSFVAVRAGISWGYADPWFAYSWQNLKGANRLAYHVIYFGENPASQMDNLFKIVGSADWEHDRLVLDCEVAHTYSKAQITKTTADCLKLCKARTGMYPIIYSRALWVNEHMSVADMPKVDWWLAQYRLANPYPFYTPEKEPPPLLPNGVTDWLIHQTGEKYNGSSVGVASYYVDSNRWNGDLMAVLQYFNNDVQVPDEPSDAEKLARLWDAHEELH